MLSQDLAQFNLPDKPGVYFFRQGKEILYIGKATSLKDRVRSYFNADVVASRGPGIIAMVLLADVVTFTETDSVLEALLLESLEIKKHRPKYNVKEKDDKSFNFVVITREVYPRVLLVRGKELLENDELRLSVKHQFGPFPRGSELREALKLIRKIFPFRDRCVPAVELIAAGKAPRPCFNSQIGLCPGVCRGTISQPEYGRIILQLKRFLEGKKKEIIRDLEREMKECVKREDFEQAAIIRNRLFALQHIQDVALIKHRYQDSLASSEKLFRIEAYDIAHLGGKDTVGVMAVTEGGEAQKSLYRKFKLRGVHKDQAHDTANLTEILTRRFTHPEWPSPDLVVIDGGQAQLSALKKVLTALELNNVGAVSVVKDEHHRAKNILGPREIIGAHETEILLANSESHRFALAYHRQVRGRMLY